MKKPHPYNILVPIVLILLEAVTARIDVGINCPYVRNTLWFVLKIISCSVKEDMFKIHQL